jgi:hypothetical protein
LPGKSQLYTLFSSAEPATGWQIGSVSFFIVGIIIFPAFPFHECFSGVLGHRKRTGEPEAVMPDLT